MDTINKYGTKVPNMESSSASWKHCNSRQNLREILDNAEQKFAGLNHGKLETI